MGQNQPAGHPCPWAMGHHGQKRAHGSVGSNSSIAPSHLLVLGQEASSPLACFLTYEIGVIIAPPSQPHSNVLEQCLAQGKALPSPSTGHLQDPVTGELQSLSASLGRSAWGGCSGLRSPALSRERTGRSAQALKQRCPFSYPHQQNGHSTTARGPSGSCLTPLSSLRRFTG